MAVDANREIRPKFPPRFMISVNLADLAIGRRQGCYDCPLALAAHRAICTVLGVDPILVSVHVMHEDLEVDVPGLRIRRYHLPEVATQFISDFDNYGAVEPLTFEARLAR
jgi:hypothetical protein